MNTQNLLDLLNNWRWPILVFVLVLVLVALFRKELAELIGKLKHLEISSKNRKFKFDFSEDIKDAKAKAKGVAGEVASSHMMRSAERPGGLKKQSARDIVLEAWGALKQIVFDACLAAGLRLSPTTGIGEAVRRLGEAKALKPELSFVVNLLNRLGEQLAQDSKLRPGEDAAREYQEVAYDLADWMMLNIVSRPVASGANPPPPPPRHATSVSDFFPKPQPGNPAAVLDGIAGIVRAKRFPVDKELFRIGRDADNDLRISGDEFVSGHHASLRYQAGSLVLSDEGSRNGTFINEHRVTGTALRQGDQVRIGNAVFRVMAASTSHAEIKTKDNEKSELVG